jgi:hypothetical protein
MPLILSGSVDISGSMTATTILVSSPGAAGMVSSSQQIQNYNLFAVTSSANTFYGTQRITGSLKVSGSIETQYATSYGITSLSATGGQITYVTPYTIHTFTASGNFVSQKDGFVEILAVGGGGAGGGVYGGGGGAGGVVHYKSVPVGVGTYSITIGQGGASVDGSVVGNPGNPTYFGDIIHAMGGGGGGAEGVLIGDNGGSGGGNSLSTATAGHGSTQGNRGGRGVDNGITGGGGGGGGAGAAGGDAGTTNPSPAGKGGIGYFCDISGTFTAYGGGGGGGAILNSTLGIGGAGGGGNGAKNANTPDSGVANTGGGGGGAGNSSSPGSGAGGSGIVIVRYLT